MNYNLRHFVPFDIGISLGQSSDPEKNNKEDFIARVQELSSSRSMHFEVNKSHRCIGTVRIAPNVDLFLFDFGVGVFVFRDLVETEELKEVTTVFGSHGEAIAYYERLLSHNRLLEIPIESSAPERVVNSINLARNFMFDLWENLPGIRRTTASANYKKCGWSYVFTLYHAQVTNMNLSEQENQEIKQLLIPAALGDILKVEKWANIKKHLESKQEEQLQGEECIRYSIETQLYSSWSGALILQRLNSKIENEAFKTLIDQEVSLQANWFFFDCLADFIVREPLNLIELNAIKSEVTELALDIDASISAKMSSAERRCVESLCRTSEISSVKDKLLLLLENRIAMVGAAHHEKQVRYGILTEILLVFLTLIQVYDPIKQFITEGFVSADMILIPITIAILLIFAWIIIKRER